MGWRSFIVSCVLIVSFASCLWATSLRHHPINERQGETLRKKRDGMTQEVYTHNAYMRVVIVHILLIAHTSLTYSLSMAFYHEQESDAANEFDNARLSILSRHRDQKLKGCTDYLLCLPFTYCDSFEIFLSVCD